MGLDLAMKGPLWLRVQQGEGGELFGDLVWCEGALMGILPVAAMRGPGTSVVNRTDTFHHAVADVDHCLGVSTFVVGQGNSTSGRRRTGPGCVHPGRSRHGAAGAVGLGSAAAVDDVGEVAVVGQRLVAAPGAGGSEAFVGSFDDQFTLEPADRAKDAEGEAASGVDE
jgi:hypothetical protein